MPLNKLCCDADSLCSMGLKWGMCGQVKNYFLPWCNRKYAWWWSGWEIYSTCALSVSRGLSTLGKAISGIPRGSSGFGLEGAAWLPLKLWTTHIPCAMQEKKQSEVSVFSPQEKPGGGMNYHRGHNWKNLTWVWVQGIICVSLGPQCGHWHGWAWWIASVMNLFTFHTDHSRDPHVCLILPEPQTTQMMPFTGQILPSDSDFVISKQWTQLCGWLNLPHICMTPFSTIPACFQHHCCGV